MNLNDPVKVAQRREADAVLVRFAVAAAVIQARAGRHFVMKNPSGSAGWSGLPALARLRKLSLCRETTFHQSRFGLCSAAGKPLKKATSFLTTIPEVADEFHRKFC